MKKIKILLLNVAILAPIPSVGFISCNDSDINKICTVTFDLGGGHIEGLTGDQMQVLKGTIYGSLPTPILPNNDFKGWSINGSKVEPTDIISNDVMIKAEYELTPATSYTILFNLNGGEIPGINPDEGIVVEAGSPYGSLPIPKKNNYIFKNWKVGERQVSATDIIDDNETVTACYDNNPPPFTYQLSGGSCTLAGQTWGSGIDAETWSFKINGVTTEPKSMDLVKEPDSPDISGISLVNQKVTWAQWLTPGEYKFRIRVIYYDWEILSDVITLTISNANFNDCGWEVVAYICDLVEEGRINAEEFCKCFTVNDVDHPGEQKQVETLNDFVGQTRILRIDNLDYNIIVLGVNQDQYSVKDGIRSATLTFQFNNFISNKSDGKCLRTWWGPCWYHHNNSDYWSSALEESLNSVKSVNWYNEGTEHRSVYTMIMNTDAQKLWVSSIKSVRRLVNVWDNPYAQKPEGWHAEEKKVKIFTPTVSNVYSKVGLTSNSDPFIKLHADEHLSEGQPEESIITKQYQYYQQEIGDDGWWPSTDHDRFKQYQCLYHEDCANNPGWYWLSSPSFETVELAGFNAFVCGHIDALTSKINGEENAGCLFTSNVLGSNKNDAEPFAVLPCFCL